MISLRKKEKIRLEENDIYINSNSLKKFSQIIYKKKIKPNENKIKNIK